MSGGHWSPLVSDLGSSSFPGSHRSSLAILSYRHPVVEYQVVDNQLTLQR